MCALLVDNVTWLKNLLKKNVRAKKKERKEEKETEKEEDRGGGGRLGVFALC